MISKKVNRYGGGGDTPLQEWSSGIGSVGEGGVVLYDKGEYNKKLLKFCLFFFKSLPSFNPKYF